MNTSATSLQKTAGKRDLFSLKIKRLVHYINSKFKIMVFEIISRSHMLNTTITYLHSAFSRVSDEARLKEGLLSPPDAFPMRFRIIMRFF